MTGTVKFFKQDTGYGFITVDDDNSELFVHASQCSGQTLKKGQKVEFSIGEGKKGDEAKEVRIIG